jgi:hypothetical protein
MSIKYDSTELQNATYLPRYIQHETSPERLIDSIKLIRQNGEIIIDDTMSIKYIDIVGVLIGSSKSDLETKIDAFKELISRKDKNLDIDWAGGTRRYVCRSIRHEFKRDFYNILHCPYLIRFLVPSGIGIATAEVTLLDKSGIVATTNSEALTFLGSVQPKPKHRIDITTLGNADVIRIENVDTGDYMDVDLKISTGFIGSFEIDEENQTVTAGTTNLNYRGKFPSVNPGLNNLKMTVYGSGSTLDINQPGYDGAGECVFAYGGMSSSPWQAQSFVPTQSGRVRYPVARVCKTDGGTLTGAMQFQIYSDDNGKPGTELISGDFEMAHDSIAGIYASVIGVWNGTDANRPYLTAGKKYWLVFDPRNLTGTDVDNCYFWSFDNDPTSYDKGKAMFMKATAETWQDGNASANLADGGVVGQTDMTFYIYMGSDGGVASHNVRWRVYYTPKYL